MRKSTLTYFILFTLVYLLFYVFTGLFFKPVLHPYFDSYSVFLKYAQSGKVLSEDFSDWNKFLNNLVFAPYTNNIQVIIGKYIADNQYGIYALWSAFFGAFSTFSFLFFKKAGFSRNPALLLAFLPMIGRQGSLLWEINTMEPFGLPFLSLSLYLAVIFLRKKSVLTAFLLIISVLLLSFSKESFILLLPGLALFLLQSSAENGFKIRFNRITVTAAIILLISLLEIAYILRSMGNTAEWRGGKVGFSTDTSPLVYLQQSLLLFKENSYYLYIILGIFILSFSKNTLKSFVFRPLTVFSLSIIGSQLLIYSSVGFQNRYLMPAAYGIVLLLSSLWSEMKTANLQKEFKYFGALLLIPFVMELSPKLFDNNQLFRSARNFGSETETVEKLLGETAAKTKESSTILIVFDAADQTLSAGVLSNYLSNLYNRKNIISFPVKSPYPQTDLQAARAENSSQPAAASLEKVDCVIVLPGQEVLFEQQAGDLLNAKKFEKKTFWLYVLYYQA